MKYSADIYLALALNMSQAATINQSGVRQPRSLSLSVFYDKKKIKFIDPVQVVLSVY